MTKKKPVNSAISDEAWWTAWIENGYNSTKAYLSLKPNVERTSAATLGMRRHAKFKKGDVYKSLENKLISNVNDLLNSEDEKIKLAITKDSLDRLRGRAKESVDLTSGGEKIQPLLVKFIDGRNNGNSR